MEKVANFVAFILSIGNDFYRAMVFMVLYNWFIPVTFGLPVIGYWLSFALIITVSVLRVSGIHKSLMHYENTKMNSEEKIALTVGQSIGMFVMLNVALFIGWLIQLNIY